MNEKFEKDQYTKIYSNLYETLKNDNLDSKIAVTTAKRLTDAIWELYLVLNARHDVLKNTVDEVKKIINNELKQNQTFSMYLNADWMID
jgi:hypothetical protein